MAVAIRIHYVYFCKIHVAAHSKHLDDLGGKGMASCPNPT